MYRRKVVYLVRHGEAESQEKDARLSERGRLQAKCAALRILDDAWMQDERLHVQLAFSPVGRAVETHDIIRAALIAESPSRMTIGTSSADERIQAGGVIGPLIKSGIPYELSVEHWLRNPTCIPGKEPDVITARVEQFLRAAMQEQADVIVGVTHEIPLAAYIQKVFRREPNACGVLNGEWIKVVYEWNTPNGYDEAHAYLRGHMEILHMNPASGEEMRRAREQEI